MAGSRKTISAGFLLLLIVAVCLLLLNNAFNSEKSAVQLPDGRWLQVEKVTFGREHVFSTGSKLSWALQKWLPLGSVKRSHWTTSRDCLMVWCTLNPPPEGPLGGGFEVVSDSGKIFTDVTWGSEYDADGSVRLCPHIYDFPREDESFMLIGTILDMPVALRIANPIYEQRSRK